MSYSQLQMDMKSAMKQKDILRLNTLRNVVSDISNLKIAQSKSRDDSVEEKMFHEVLRILAKQRKDSIEQYKNAGRVEQAKNEELELEILMSYLPANLSIEQINLIIDKHVDKIDTTQKANQKLVIKPIMTEIEGRADGKEIIKLIQSRFN